MKSASDAPPVRPAAPGEGPRAVYAERLDACRRLLEEADRADARLGNARLWVFAATVAVAGFALAGRLAWPWVLVPLLGFVVLVVLHGRVRARREAARRRARLHERGLARIEDRWAGEGDDGGAFRPAQHRYAEDLDLFGAGSLFQLLSTARTRVGGACLARFLLEPASHAETRGRQEAVRALADRLDLREDVALAGEEVRSALERDAALTWARATPRLAGRLVPWLALALGLVTTALFAGWAFSTWPFWPFAASAFVQFLALLPVRARVDAVLAAADRPGRDLALVAALLERFEAERFEAGRLGELRRALEAEGQSPSREIARLVRLLDFVDARRNQIFLPISWLLALGTQLAYAIEAWRAKHGTALLGWLDALGEFEALLALSTYAYEHPGDAFPDLVPEAVFDARELGHPLLSASANVRNDVHLARGSVQALLVSGSNMSGKSTLLRSVGVAVVMGRAGAPVRAGALRLGPLALGGSIRVQDSLQSGASRFYAEIRRLKEIVDLARTDAPGLFLLDEMLGGTNSHDRRIGADAVIHTLLDAGALGLVSTHDLALAAIAEKDPRMANVHFEDRIEEGRMVFDYRLREGVVTHSNAVALMRAVGLDVRDG